MTIQITMSHDTAEWLIDYIGGSLNPHAAALVASLNTELDAHHKDNCKTVRLGGEFKVFWRDANSQRRYIGYVQDTGQTAQEAFAAFKAGKGGRV
jgi:hypothetical protein